MLEHARTPRYDPLYPRTDFPSHNAGCPPSSAFDLSVQPSRRLSSTPPAPSRNPLSTESIYHSLDLRPVNVLPLDVLSPQHFHTVLRIPPYPDIRNALADTRSHIAHRLAEGDCHYMEQHWERYLAAFQEHGRGRNWERRPWERVEFNAGLRFGKDVVEGVKLLQRLDMTRDRDMQVHPSDQELFTCPALCLRDYYIHPPINCPVLTIINEYTPAPASSMSAYPRLQKTSATRNAIYRAMLALYIGFTLGGSRLALAQVDHRYGRLVLLENWTIVIEAGPHSCKPGGRDIPMDRLSPDELDRTGGDDIDACFLPNWLVEVDEQGRLCVDNEGASRLDATVLAAHYLAGMTACPREWLEWVDGSYVRGYGGRGTENRIHCSDPQDIPELTLWEIDPTDGKLTWTACRARLIKADVWARLVTQGEMDEIVADVARGMDAPVSLWKGSGGGSGR